MLPANLGHDYNDEDDEEGNDEVENDDDEYDDQMRALQLPIYDKGRMVVMMICIWKI